MAGCRLVLDHGDVERAGGGVAIAVDDLVGERVQRIVGLERRGREAVGPGLEVDAQAAAWNRQREGLGAGVVQARRGGVLHVVEGD